MLDAVRAMLSMSTVRGDDRYASVRRPSVSPSVHPSARRLSQHGPTAAKPQEISIDCCTVGVRRVNAGSATLSAYVVAEHRDLISLRRSQTKSRRSRVAGKKSGKLFFPLHLR